MMSDDEEQEFPHVGVHEMRNITGGWEVERGVVVLSAVGLSVISQSKGV